MDLICEIGQEPVFINQEGFSWYLAKNETRYAQTTQLRVGGEDLPALKDIIVFAVYTTKDDIFQSFVVMGQNNEIIRGEGLGVNNIGSYLDSLKLVRQHEGK